MATPFLAVSNGHGEDLIAAEVIRHLEGVDAVAYPLVGLGQAYPPRVRLLDPRRVFPSGGFAFRDGLRGLSGDLRAGFVRFWLAQRRTLRAQRGCFALAMAVGDPYCLAMALLAGAPTVLVASADSVLHAPYGPLPLRVLRRAVRVFTRDEPTAADLRRRGIPAAYLGNVMLDCLQPAVADFTVAAGRPVVTLLPGSRSDAPRNAALLGEVAARIARSRPDVQFLLSLAPTVEEETVLQALRRSTGSARHSSGARTDPGAAPVEVGPARLTFTRAFAPAVERADVVVGLAGTANEQAAGLGKPVVAFPGPGPQFTARFLALQRHLLGEAIVAASNPDQAAAAVLQLLASPQERARRGQAGRERMGAPGAAARVAAEIQRLLTGAPAGTGR
ncbi:MAG: lipid-A-disaccharide synthase-related protein [Armatimonadota bacterium]|nr:lipid-A-disaccharide synthase-related protein [Armatimonadota bacterium]MDR7463450.1 lipid-A-disaccharide synthase-related protein [Armatimonadota bacterium]MDR7473963.1 lipid-A-disaccharide synthase-related protein [Armatimonadota bacterium]MDR7540203.1 lipid-A-disaccharide synthase-related protein [Armatimonadota bacterium]